MIESVHVNRILNFQLKYGVDIFAEDINGLTPFHFAAAEGLVDVMCLLKHQGDSIRWQMLNECIYYIVQCFKVPSIVLYVWQQKSKVIHLKANENVLLGMCCTSQFKVICMWNVYVNKALKLTWAWIPNLCSEFVAAGNLLFIVTITSYFICNVDII